jgi:hypothetical protein
VDEPQAPDGQKQAAPPATERVRRKGECARHPGFRLAEKVSDMSKIALQQAPPLKPADRRPWPEVGDKSIEETYAAVGRALSNWERYEWVLSHLFSVIVSDTESEAARRAYGAVRTFEGRIDMLEAARLHTARIGQIRRSRML